MPTNDIQKIINLIKKLAFFAYYDSLTKILNRRGFYEKIKELGILKKNKFKEKRKINHALILIDVDNFKQINDNYDYKTGDKILKSVAQKLKRNFREEDIVCRWGGDEFLIIMHEVSEKIVNEKIKNLEDEKLSKYNSGLSIAYELFPYGSNFQSIFKKANLKLKKIKMIKKIKR